MHPMSNKSPEMRAAIDDLFPGTLEAIKGHRCPSCHGEVGEFKDALSKREYMISGLCQSCQDSVWGD